MNELDYAKMIEIPVSSCDVTYKKPPAAKRRKRRNDALKRELIDKVNDETAEPWDQTAPETEYASVQITTKAEERRRARRERKPITFDVVSAQVAVIIVLLLTVLLTNIFWRDSGINTLLRSAFAGKEQTAEEPDRAYTDFVPSLPSRSAEVFLNEGVMTFSGEGSIYSVCDGTVEKVLKNGDKYDVTLKYSQSFSAVISGVDYAYYSEGDAIYKSLPVCYSNGGEVRVYLYSEGRLLTDYMLDNGRIVWQS